MALLKYYWTVNWQGNAVGNLHLEARLTREYKNSPTKQACEDAILGGLPIGHLFYNIKA